MSSTKKASGVRAAAEPALVSESGGQKDIVKATLGSVSRKKAATAAPAAKKARKASPVSPAVEQAAEKSTAKVGQKNKGTVGASNEASASNEGKVKLVRDSFTMPRDDFDLVGKLKERALGFKRPVKKSELLRAGLHALQGLPDAKLKSVLDGLTPLKAGRPKKQAD